MPSIDDFVNHCWADAKEVLRQLDPDYVREIEETVRLQDVGLEPPWVLDVERSPKRRLPKHWHLMLEACYNLTMQVSILQIAATELTADSNNGMSNVEVGRRHFYYYKNWVIHANTLVEFAKLVIKCTTKVYVADVGARKRIAKRHCDAMDQLFPDVKEPRDQSAHGGRALAKALTEEGLWEGHVSTGKSPKFFLDESIYPLTGHEVMSGKYDGLVCFTETKIDDLGKTLHELEQDIAAHNAQAGT